MDWLEHHCDTGTLIRYFEQQYERHEREQEGREREGPLRRLQRKLGAQAPQPSAHHEYLLWLAMLHERAGAFEQARGRLDEYAVAVEARRLAAEVARVERHRDWLARLSDR